MTAQALAGGWIRDRAPSSADEAQLRPAPAMTLSGRLRPAGQGNQADGLHRLSGRIPRGRGTTHPSSCDRACTTGPRAKVRLAAPTASAAPTGAPSAATRPPATTRRPIGSPHLPPLPQPGSPPAPGSQIIRTVSPASRAPAASLRERSAPPDPGLPRAPHGTCREQEGPEDDAPRTSCESETSTQTGQLPGGAVTGKGQMSALKVSDAIPNYRENGPATKENGA